ncbi:MAG: T9SS type A sorting domain-containing protein [Candidatus Delongbacteria bacterium]|nr:T9SS type A sorting domain-containing protein [Candidatus Delongbacteria bacterium]
MKRTILIILISLTMLSAFVKLHEYAVVKISGLDDIKFLQDNKIDIDRTSFTAKGLPESIKVYVTEEEFSMLTEAGYTVSWTPLQIPKDATQFYDNQSIGDSMLAWQNRYPEICQRIQIGTTVQGRELWVLKITDSLDIEEAEPEVKFVSTMHGDEVTGMEMEMYMIEDILQGYYADNDTMQFIVNNTELYIMPLMNPDGNELGQRYNANYIDLNRNFPEGTYYEPDTILVSTIPENQAMISWTKAHNFILSTNFHGGAEVANFVFDKDFGVANGAYAAAPDDAHAYWLAYGYASRNPRLFGSSSFTDGVTNGCDWYSIDGGMQDWNYRYHNDMDMTLEISGTKWPSYSSMPVYWQENRNSMFWYLSAAHKGIYGVVTDSVSGVPVAATIQIAGIDKDYYTDPDKGDYYRILIPGTYTMTVSCPGYFPQTIDNIVVTDDTGVFKEATEVNVQLVKNTGIDNEQFTMDNLQLEQNYPNPFNPTTTISFINDKHQNISINIYDQAGKLVEKVVDNKFTAGKFSFEFNGDKLSSGIYYGVLRTDDGIVQANKMVLIK